MNSPYREKAAFLLRQSYETDDLTDRARYVLAAQVWLNFAVAAEARSFAPPWYAEPDEDEIL